MPLIWNLLLLFHPNLGLVNQRLDQEAAQTPQ